MTNNDDGTICGYKIHRFCYLFPKMTNEEYDSLKEDVKLNGQIEPVLITSNNEILDGFHRSKIVSELGMELKTVLFEGNENDYLNVVISKNLKRRMLTTNQKALLGCELLDLFKNDAKLRKIRNLKQNDAPNASQDALGKSSHKAALLVGSSSASIERAKGIITNGSDQLIEAVKNNEINLTDANDISKFGKDKQTRLIKESKTVNFKDIRKSINDEQILASASWINSKRSSENAKQHSEARKVANKHLKIPTGKYSTIIIDFPWDIGKGSDLNRMGEIPYPMMSIEEIKNQKDTILNIANNDCFLMLWSPISFLPTALNIITHFGFKYKFNIVWVKRRNKGGLCGVKPTGYPRYIHEHLIVGSIGNPKFDDVLNFDTVIDGERREHSRKPKEIYKILERVCPKPIIDLYSREDWKKSNINIDNWGLESDKFNNV